MSLTAIGIIGLGLVFLRWAYRLYMLCAPQASALVLSPDGRKDIGDVGLVSVILPARDEAGNIAAALTGILAQDYRRIEVIVVDDRSRDRTAEIVRDIAAQDFRVSLVPVTALPEGWFGKQHAMHAGVQAARGDWLWFVDADCRQAPQSLRVGLSYLLEQGGDMLTLWPRLEAHGFWENVVQPVAGATMAALLPALRVNDPKRRVAFANGQYMLMRRTMYEAVGGMAAVRNEITEDVCFGRVVKAAGFRILVAVGRELFSTRMYDSLKSIAAGWTRIYYGTCKRPAKIVVLVLLTFLLGLSPFLALSVSLPMAICQVGRPWSTGFAMLSIATIAVIYLAARRYYFFGGLNRWYIVFYPIGVAVTMIHQARALLHALGFGVLTWRGMQYKGGRVVASPSTS